LTSAAYQKPAGADVSAFLASLALAGGQADAVLVFHGVRQLPYYSSGDRSLEGILTNRRGSCSSKHILLAALLNKIGVPADVELVRGDFATPLRFARNIPQSFVEAARDGIRDIHNVVRARINGRPILLDATWHDAVKPYGFRVNDAWVGKGNTQVAVDVEEYLGATADPAGNKARIIATWPAEEQAKRRRFLEAINAWVGGLDAAAPSKN
jgi:transglutaminase-like putative cysteine protease